MEQDERDLGTARACPRDRTAARQRRAGSDQLDSFFSLISKFQQGYRDLIDTFEDLLFSITLDGTILTVNRSFADLLGLSFAGVVGASLDEFFKSKNFFPNFRGPQKPRRNRCRGLERRAGPALSAPK